KSPMSEVDSPVITGQAPAARLPADRIRQFEFSLTQSHGADDPFDVIVPRMHEGPEVYWSPEGLRPGEGAWIFRSEAEVRKAFLDTASFSSAGISGVLKAIGSDDNLIPVEI